MRRAHKVRNCARNGGQFGVYFQPNGCANDCEPLFSSTNRESRGDDLRKYWTPCNEAATCFALKKMMTQRRNCIKIKMTSVRSSETVSKAEMTSNEVKRLGEPNCVKDHASNLEEVRSLVIDSDLRQCLVEELQRPQCSIFVDNSS